MDFHQTQEELQQHYEEQLRFLRSSSIAYDSGDESEAKRLAVHIRILVHDTHSSHSLLGQLGLKESLLFYDTVSGVFEQNLASSFGLVIAQLSSDSESRFIAPLEEHEDSAAIRWVPFEEWWHETVFIDQERNHISRKELLLAVADQDGGAHVDPKINEVYAKLTRGHSLGWSYETRGETGPLRHEATASIRQMAFEVIKTLEDRHFSPVGRNDPCPCGSGKKYKKCCGA